MKRPVGRVNTRERLHATRVCYQERRRASEGLANSRGWDSPRGVMARAKSHGTSQVLLLSYLYLILSPRGLFIVQGAKGNIPGHQTQFSRTQADFGDKSGATGIQAGMDRRLPDGSSGDRKQLM